MMRHARLVSRILLTLTLLSMVTSPVRAITDEEIFRQLRFNFISPGGRALGMGGTFIALADDATAAQANPAGLIQLAAPEFFFEERNIGGHKSSSNSTLSGVFDFSIDNERRPITSPTFFSYVYPWKKLALGFSRQEVLHTRVAVDSVFSIPSLSQLNWQGIGEVDVEDVHWNVSLAYRPSKWFSIGGTASLGQFHIDGHMENTISDPTGALICNINGGPIDCDTDNNGVIDPVVPALAVPYNWYSTHIDDDDRAFAYSLGVLVFARENLSFGLVRRSKTDYGFTETRTEGISGLVSSGFFANPSASLDQDMHLPSSTGFGSKWRPLPNWTLVLDVVKINYSDLLHGLQTNINVFTSVLRAAPLDYTIPDATEIHLGGEYLFTNAKLPWALRAGIYSDPDNVLQDQGNFLGDTLKGRNNEMHYTVGAGVVMQQKFQADVALSFSSLGNEGVASFIYRF
jgi:long-chain fatty acid transport protein